MTRLERCVVLYFEEVTNPEHVVAVPVQHAENLKGPWASQHTCCEELHCWKNTSFVNTFSKTCQLPEVNVTIKTEI